MRVRELLRRVDWAAPFSLAQDWDNVGLMVGDLEAEVQRVGIALDAVPQAVITAAERGCQALLCHHPLLFHPIKKLDLNAGPGPVIREAVKRNIAILAAHTNWDCAEGGVSAELARLIGLEGIEALDPNTGLGARGLLPEPMLPEGFLVRVKDAWGLTRLDLFGAADHVQRVALCGGSGAAFWSAARAWRADLYLTADMKYHELMDATGAGLPVALADHGEMERASLPELARRIATEGDVDVILLDVRGLEAPRRF